MYIEVEFSSRAPHFEFKTALLPFKNKIASFVSRREIPETFKSQLRILVMDDTDIQSFNAGDEKAFISKKIEFRMLKTILLIRDIQFVLVACLV